MRSKRRFSEKIGRVYNTSIQIINTFTCGKSKRLMYVARDLKSGKTYTLSDEHLKKYS